MTSGEETVRGCIQPDEFESEWCWRLFIPSETPGWPGDVIARYFEFAKGNVYDLPKDLVEEYAAAIAARDVVDEKLREIIKTGKGKVE
jgi:hypothetical protein